VDKDSADAGPASGERPPPRVLLVEDDAPSATRLSQLLSEDGFFIEWIADALLAVERLDAGPRPDVLVLDYRLPRGDGLLVARKARARWADIPVIFVTSYPEIVQREPPFDPPALILSKPVAYNELVVALHRALASHP
jgi:two-component system cell cycle sensor histidine kinase/response regulator CckA